MVRARQTSAEDSDVEDVSQAKQVEEEGSAPGSEAEEDDEEYEIEAILDHSKGSFGTNSLSYLVKWKGYGESENSWIPEADSGNAQELVEAYWKRIGGRPGAAAKKPRKSDTKPKTSATQKRKSPPSAMDIDSDGEPAPTKKRGRTSKASISDDDEPPKKPTKTAKSVTKSTNGSTSAASKKSRALADDDEEEERPYTSMKKFKNAASWDHLVERIETVERTSDGGLKVYFVLKSQDGQDGAFCCEDSEICKEKMPKKMFAFYESNLSWRRAD